MGFTLTVKSVKGDKVEVEVDSLEMKVSDFKALLEQKTGTPAGEQRLIFAGHMLKDENTLASHNIKESGVTINMVRAAPQRRPEPEPEPQPAGGRPRMGGPLGGLGRDPAALRMFAQLLQNPEMLEAAMQEIPELSRPEVQETLRTLQQNPQMLNQLLRMLDEGQGQALHVFSADELNTALTSVMRNLNIQPGAPSEPVTAEDFRVAFATAMEGVMRQGRGGRGRAAGARAGGAAAGQPRQRPAHQFITKEFLQRCLANAMRSLRN